MRCRLFLAVTLISAVAAPARADPPPPPPARAIDPAQVSGLATPERQPGDNARGATAALTFLPRKAVDFVFFATGTAAGLIRDEQVVPRVEELLSPRPGDITLLPMIFLDTRQAPSVGARMLARGDAAATSLAAGFGGVHDFNVESRVRLGTPAPLPLLVAIEALFDERSSLDYLGVGQVPDEDGRNRFLARATTHEATYYEKRARALVSVGIRPQKDFEVFLSSSLNKSRVIDTPDGGEATLSNVFVPGSVPGFGADTRFFYSELALRIDTRPTLGTPSPGYLLEGYTGIARGAGDDPTRFLRVGGRAGVFLPIVKRTTILAPRLAIDAVTTDDPARLPFTQLSSQPDFRGFDTRRDRISAVASLDYRWMITNYFAGRIFGDAAAVAPELASLLANHPRYAVGIGVDLFSSSTEIGQLAFAYSGDGVRVLFTFGVPAAFGDRQHRY